VGLEEKNGDNIVKAVFNIVGNILLIIVLATVVVPVGYLAWRAGQPMGLPQFNSLTYYKYLDWRKSTLHQMAVDYQVAHPNAKMGGGLDMCYRVDATSLLLGLPMTGFYTLAGAFPNLEKYVPPRDRLYVPQDVPLLAFLPDWWNTYEQYVWYMASTTVYGPIPYCRLAATPSGPASVNP
jgi:hypothetical protein